MLDRRERPLRELRVSLTDRCNFRCPYCMPREVFGATHRFLSRDEILTFEEIVRAVRAFQALGVKKVRLTGGEPLLRADLPRLVRLLRDLPDLEVALTTNGALLSELAQTLADAGLQRVTVSLDALDAETFQSMSDTRVLVADVLRGIEAAQRAGLAPLKINTVVRRSVNLGAVVDIARHFRGTGITVRFIEFMDVGNSNRWDSRDVVSQRELFALIDKEFPLEPIAARHPSEVARRYRYRDGAGEVGIVASVTEPFCGDCSRARLSADGHLFKCLFASQGTDLRPQLRANDDDALRQAIASAWQTRNDNYSERRHLVKLRPKVEMSFVGG